MRKYNLLDVQLYFERHGCKLLSESYISCNKKLIYRCICGEISSITFSKFKLGSRCKNCGIMNRSSKRKFSYKFVKNFFELSGCKLLSDNYLGCFEPLKYICSCGNISVITFASFKQGHRCKKCGILKGENNPSWNVDREAVIRNALFGKRCYSILRHSLTSLGIKKTKNLLFCLDILRMN